MKYTTLYKIHHTVACFRLHCPHSDLCLFPMIVVESLDRLGSLCCIFVYFVGVFAAENSELAKIQQSPVLPCLDWDLGLEDLSGKCAVGERFHSLNHLHVLSLDPYRGIIPAGQLCTTYIWLLRGKKRVAIQTLKCQENGAVKGKKHCKEFTSQ